MAGVEIGISQGREGGLEVVGKREFKEGEERKGNVKNRGKLEIASPVALGVSPG